MEETNLLTPAGQLVLLQALVYDMTVLRRLLRHATGAIQIEADELAEMQTHVADLERLRVELHTAYMLAASHIPGPVQ
jgi:hypothetical protein